MPSTILSDNGASSGTAGLKSTGSNDGQLVLQTTTAGGTATTAMTINTGQAVTFAQTANLPNTFGFKNRIINGGMVIDQRNAGASVTQTTAGLFSVDRWQANGNVTSKYTAQQNAGSVTPPAGFVNYIGITSSSAYSVLSADVFWLAQAIEGYNVADLDWGAADAKSITLSFWVRSSLTGTFGGALRNAAVNRSYPFTYTISAANTWEQKVITIAGDTTGTWNKTNDKGINLNFGLGAGSTFSGTAGAWAAGNFVTATGATSVVGTSGATFYITGVQLEAGSTATSFDYRDYGRELILCQRYYYKTAVAASAIIAVGAYANTTTDFSGFANFPVRLRTAPSALEQSGTASDYRWNGATQIACSVVPAFSSRTTTDMWQVNFAVASGLTAGDGGSAVTNSGNGYLAWSAEL
jgi:hypothetical protein